MLHSAPIFSLTVFARCLCGHLTRSGTVRGAAAPPAAPTAAAPGIPQAAPFAPKQVNLTGTTLSFVQWASFIPTADAFLNYPAAKACTNVDGKYLTVPHDAGGGIVHWPKSWFAEAGSPTYPQTYADLHTVGKTLKDAGRPLGQAFGHSFGDPPGWCYSMMWGYGGQEVDANGKVAINSAATIAAVSDMKQAFTDAYDDTGLA